MSNITFDSNNFSSQLGIYDFFNVLLSGATFIFGICIINTNINEYLWDNVSFAKGLGIILAIYIIGMVIQELGSKLDKSFFNLYVGMHRSILKGTLDDNFKSETTNKIIKNPVVLKQYREYADRILAEHMDTRGEEHYENKYANGYVFSVCQYYVSVYGKDQKIEKMRALFNMSKTLLACFILLAIFAFFSIFFHTEMSIKICSNIGISTHGCEHCIDKVLLTMIFAGLGVVFFFRSKRTMRNFLAILLGTYDAIIRFQKNNKKFSRSE